MDEKLRESAKSGQRLASRLKLRVLRKLNPRLLVTSPTHKSLDASKNLPASLLSATCTSPNLSFNQPVLSTVSQGKRMSEACALTNSTLISLCPPQLQTPALLSTMRRMPPCSTPPPLVDVTNLPVQFTLKRLQGTTIRSCYGCGGAIRVNTCSECSTSTP